MTELDEDTRKNRNLRAFLAMIRACEGTAAPNGYRYLFGSTYDNERLFDSYACHPNIKQAFTKLDGTIGYTTAAGAYQFIYGTWQMVAKMGNLYDFSPGNQDYGAIINIRRKGAMEVVQAGDVRGAIDLLWIEWASLPSSQYSQPKRTEEFAVAAYEEAGGAMA